MRKILNIAFIVIIISILQSCSGYNKVLKSTDSEFRYRKALEYYEKRDFMRASSLIEELIPVFRGTERAEELTFKYAYCQYYLGDYETAGYHFRNFAKVYLNSKWALDADFRAAYCYYLESPKPALDQTSTVNAINELQLFVEKYPDSERAKDCNGLITTMREKLAEKSYMSAKLYYDLDEYKAAIVSLKNSLKDFPDTKFRETIVYMIVKASYTYAEKSIASKQRERYIAAEKEQKNYLAEFPNEKNAKEVSRMANNTQIFLEKHKVAEISK